MSGSESSNGFAAATFAANRSAVASWNSTSKAAWFFTDIALSSAVASGSRWETRKLVASMSSIAAKPALTKSGKERVASASDSKINKPVAKCE